MTDILLAMKDLPATSVLSIFMGETPSSRHFFKWAFDFICLVKFPLFEKRRLTFNR